MSSAPSECDFHSSDGHSGGRSASADRARLKFPSPFEFRPCLPVTLVELRMRQFSDKVRQKARWWTKVSDASIVAKWRAEMIEQDRVLVERFWGGEERFVCGEGEKKWHDVASRGGEVEEGLHGRTL